METAFNKVFLLSFIIAILFFGCSQNQNTGNEFYYIIGEPFRNQTKNVSNDSILEIRLPNPTFYGNYNFILFDSSKVYVHQLPIEEFGWCGTNRKEDDLIKPPRLFLLPNKLTEVKLHNLKKFLMLIPDSVILHRSFFASISSPLDTIRNKGFKTITDFFKLKNVNKYNIRYWTEEEKFVSMAKNENEEFNSDKVNWSIGFDSENSLTDKIKIQR